MDLWVPPSLIYSLKTGWQTVSPKGHSANIFGSVGHAGPVRTIQFYFAVQMQL